MISLRVILPLAILAGCVSGSPTSSDLVSADKVSYQALIAAKRDEPSLRRLLSDTTHRLRLISGPETRYFGQNGKALFFLENEGRVVSGEWTILPTKIFGYSVCSSQGRLPQPLAGKALVENCRRVEEFVGVADYLSKGDPLGLRQKAP